MIPPETPVGTRVRVYERLGDEGSAWVGVTVTTVDAYVTVRAESDQRCWRVQALQVEPIGAKPFPTPQPSRLVQCPKCSHEFER